jgi:hypothetical protein
MTQAGKPFKVTIIAIARKLLTQINTMIKEEREYIQNHS